MLLNENAPAVILVEPQMGENIGAAARAMLNFGLSDMRIVKPRDGWPNERAVALAARADLVLEKARIFDSVATATEDLQHVYATTARPRDMIKHVATPNSAAKAMRELEATGGRAGILFGKESYGLTSEDITYADTIITVPLNPEFTSINRGQAVLLVAYEYFQLADETPDLVIRNEERRATKKEVVALFDRIESSLDANHYFDPIKARRPVILRNMRNMFQRFDLMESDIRAFHGIIKGLTAKKRDK